MQNVLRCAALLFLAIVPARAHHHRYAVDLQGFRGVYHGTVVVTLAGRTYPGTARIIVQVTKRGHSATMVVVGGFISGGRKFSISNHFTFLSNRHFTEQSVTNGFASPSIGVAGKYGTHAQKLAFRAPFTAGNTSGESVVEADIHPGNHGKQILELHTSVALDGQAPDYLYNFQVSKYIVP